MGKQILRHFSELNMTPSCLNCLASFDYLVMDKTCISSCLFFCLFLYFMVSYFVLFYILMNFLQNTFQSFWLRRLQVRSYYLITINFDLDFSIFEKPHFWRVSLTKYLVHISHLCIPEMKYVIRVIQGNVRWGNVRSGKCHSGNCPRTVGYNTWRLTRSSLLLELSQSVIFKPLSYCFEETIGFDVKASFASRPVLRLIRWYNKPGDVTKEFWEKAIRFHGTFHGLKITNCSS